MRRLIPVSLCLMLAACGGGPLSVIPPAELALLGSDVAPAPASDVALVPGAAVLPETVAMAAGALPGAVDPVALSFRQALCVQAMAARAATPDAPAAPMPDCDGTDPDAMTASLPAGVEAVPAIVPPAAISVTDMLARVRGTAAQP